MNAMRYSLISIQGIFIKVGEIVSDVESDQNTHTFDFRYFQPQKNSGNNGKISKPCTYQCLIGQNL